MKGTTHASFAVVSNVIVSNVQHVQLEPKTFAVLAVASTFGGLLPDIDHGNSKLGKKVPVVDKLFKHRGFTHTVWFAMIAYVIVAMWNEQIAMYVFIGCLSHLIGDILTPMGLRPFKLGFDIFPIKLRLPIIQNDLTEKVVQGILYIALPFLVM